MNETKKKKVPLEGFIRLPKPLDRLIEGEATRLDLFKYEIVERMWIAYSKSPQKGDQDSTEMPTQESLPGTDLGIIELHNATRDSAISSAINLVSQSLEALRDIQDSFGGIQEKSRRSRKAAGDRGSRNRSGARSRGKD